MDNKCINNIKALAIDMIDKAQSGHPGIALGAAPIVYTIYSKHMVTSYVSDDFENRDRFILSAGHGSALLYATFFMAGFEYELDDLKDFRQYGSKTPGHPEYGECPRVEATTGPLGQGIAMAVGMALGAKIKNEEYKNVLKRDLYNYKVYALCGDGDLMEGISYEAASLAGNLELDNLIVLYDSNKITLDGKTNLSFNENVLNRFKAMGWYVDEVRNGMNASAIDRAVSKAKKQRKPAFIKIDTTIGHDSLLQNTNVVHGKPLSKEDITQLKKKLKVPNEPFYVDEKARDFFRNQIVAHSNKKIEAFHDSYNEYVRIKGRTLKDPNTVLRDDNFDIEIGKKETTRKSNSIVMQKLAEYIPEFVGGSADLSSSNMTYLTDFGIIEKGKFNGKNIFFGVREHAMGAILNGLALTNLKAFASTFLVFSDYMKPAIRLSALMNLPVNYIFTHDSIMVGEDGATHQPIEQLSMLRTIPNLNVFRPCDIKEVIGSWKVMIASKETPNALILSRNEVETLENSSSSAVRNGAYIIRNEKEKLDGIIIATGSEVGTALEIANDLYMEKNMDLRVVSMPCAELFDLQNDEYKNKVLPKNILRISLEASSKISLLKYSTGIENCIGIDKFGTSAPVADVLRYCGFTKAQIQKKIEEMVKKYEK